MKGVQIPRRPNRKQELIEQRKSCTNCGIIKSFTEYHKNKSTIDGVSAKCKVCLCEWSNYRYRNNIANKRDKEKNGRLKKSYNITLNEFKSMLKEQKYKCSICGFKLKEGLHTHIDHCHRCGKVRGILCSNCNHGLGSFYDDPSIINSAMEYIEVHKHEDKN